jgi:hypothetical protein
MLVLGQCEQQLERAFPLSLPALLTLSLCHDLLQECHCPRAA